MLAAQIQPDYAIAPAELASPPLPENGALLKLSGCGLCGSDLEKFAQKKAAPGVVLGHEVVGTIQALDEALTNKRFQVGDRIVTAHHTPCGYCHYCRFGSESMCPTFKRSNLMPGGFSEIIALTSEHLDKTAFKIPSHISDEAASCVEPLACVLKAVDRLELKKGQSALVVGLGFIGLLAAQVLHTRGVEVIGIDLNQKRLELAEAQNWLKQAINVDSPKTLQAAVDALNETQKADAVFLSVVNTSTLETAFSHIRDGGRLLVFAGAQNTSIDPSQLYYREISVISSYSPSLKHLQEAATLIFEQRVNVSPLITHRYSLSQIAEAMGLYQSGQAIKIFITAD
ncbi:MAG: alcohol dehydrogenase catalytic domain-containing protein [Vampirovibrionales bacterium]|nr:alcohol dehydrogenase catalytic domain-containing protein [Vampirovibrionales bacterium]